MQGRQSLDNPFRIAEAHREGAPKSNSSSRPEVNPDPSSRGERRGVALELAILFTVLWMDALVPGIKIEPYSPGFHLEAFIRALPRIALVFLFMRRDPGSRLYGTGIRRLLPTASDLAWALAVAGSAGLASALPALVSGLAGLTNPIFSGAGTGAGVGTGGTSPAGFLAAAALSSLATGYLEELFFRGYAPAALVRLGVSGVSSALLCSLVFGALHGAQGVAGIATAAAIGGLFAAFRIKGRSLHSLALGHALYNFIALAASFALV
jgi:membrane protease YdiL (CAAX protease family)